MTNHFNKRHTSSWWQNTKWPIRAKLSQEGCKRSPCLCPRDAFSVVTWFTRSGTFQAIPLLKRKVFIYPLNHSLLHISAAERIHVESSSTEKNRLLSSNARSAAARALEATAAAWSAAKNKTPKIWSARGRCWNLRTDEHLALSRGTSPRAHTSAEKTAA